MIGMMERETRLFAIAAGTLATVAAAGIAVYYSLRPHPPAPKPAAPMVTQPAPVTPPPAPAEVVLPGKVQATQVVDVPVPIDGNIEEFLADVGEDVTKGEVLARISSPKLAGMASAAQFEAERARTQIAALESSILSARLEVSRAEGDVERTKAELERAKKEYERQQVMMREGVTPRLVFEKSQQDYEALKVQAQNQAEAAKRAADRVASLSKDLEDARRTAQQRATQADEAKLDATAGEVPSPVDGVVVSRRGQKGEPVTRAMKDFFQIATDLSKLQIVISPDPEVLQRIHPEQPVAIEIPEAQIAVDGRIREVKADQATIEFANKSPIVRPGMTARIRIK